MPTPTSVINTIFPADQGFDGLPVEVKDPYSPGPGVNNEHPVGIEAGSVAPGLGVASSNPALGKAPSSSPNPNRTSGGAMAPGLGVADDSSEDDSNVDSGHGPVSVLPTKTALTTVDGGQFMPGGTPINVSQNNVAGQAFGLGLTPTYQGGAH